MVRISSITALCSALIGMSRAAALGSAEQYASGEVHAYIMGIKMVYALKVLP
jgi:hypothetical protein